MSDVGIIEILIGIITAIIGLVALTLMAKAIPKLSKGLTQTFFKRFLSCLLFLVFFSIWHTLREYYDWKTVIGGFMEYPEYIFISLAYISFLLTARKGLELAKKIGFK